MAKFLSKLGMRVFASILLILPGTILPSQAAETKQVLILNAWDSHAAPYDRPTENFRAELQRQFSEPIAFSEFSLDAREPESESREELLAELLRDRLVDAPPDIVFAMGPPAIRFWIEHRDMIAARASLIALTVDGVFSPEDLRRGDVARLTRFSFLDPVDEILRLRPATSHVVMVFGSTPRERAATAQARNELVAHSERLRFEYTNDLTLQELQARLGELSEESAVYFGVLNVDGAGVILPRDEGLSTVRSASPVPIFGTFDNQVGMGIVGGRLMQLRMISLDAAASAAAILRGEPVRDAWTVTDLGTPVYDWRELDRWGIDIGLLPAGSEIRHRPPSLWDQYAAWIVLVTTVVAIQSLLIVALVTQRRRRAAAELAKAKLGGQLINAYEDQHRAIARELHDDLSQRLARLAIDAGLIGRDQNSDTLVDELENLREQLASVSEDVHDMSYRLHPSLVEDLGISTALRTECQHVREHADVSIKEHIGETHGKIPNNAALCAFRIIQEALSNAVRHASADSIEVIFERDGQALRLEVSDDGRGFDETQLKPGKGIGLSSMQERVQLLGGTLSIQSTPGTGTTVSAVLPLAGENP